MSRAASGAPFSASCCALPSVLNRKCGSICSCSSFSFDSASCRDVSLCRASASRCAVSARYSRLRRWAISAVTNANRKPNTSPAVTTCRSFALSWTNANGSTPWTRPAMLAPTSAPASASSGADDDVAEDPALEPAVAEPGGQSRPEQRQHDEVEQDRRLGERHVPRQLATRSTRRAWSRRRRRAASASRRSRRTSGRTRVRRGARSRTATPARAARTRRSGT